MLKKLKTLALSTVLLGIGATSVMAQFQPLPKPPQLQLPKNLAIYKVQYQFCLPEAVMKRINYRPLVGYEGRCTDVKTTYVWSVDPPVPELRFLSKRQSWDRYEVQVKAWGCPTDHLSPQKPGWYMGEMPLNVKHEISRSTANLPLIYKSEKINPRTPLPGIRRCMFRREI